MFTVSCLQASYEATPVAPVTIDFLIHLYMLPCQLYKYTCSLTNQILLAPGLYIFSCVCRMYFDIHIHDCMTIVKTFVFANTL